MAYSSKNRKRKRNRSGKYVLAAVVLMCTAVVIGAGAFFRITEIDVQGLTAYTSEEVVASSGIEMGDNLITLRESSTVLNIRKTFPYIDKITIKRELPGRIVITITECVPTAYVLHADGFWKLDRNCKLLERTDASGVAGLIQLRGVEMLSPSEGQSMALGEENESQLSLVKNVLGLISDNKMTPDVGYLDVENTARLSFSYGDKYVVNLGSGANLDVKFATLLKVIPSLEDGDIGTIDMSNPSEPHFIPE